MRVKLRELLVASTLCVAWLAGGVCVAADKPVRLAYVEWSSSIASAHVVCAVLEQRLGHDCRLEAMTADQMWAAVAEGRADAMLSAWLPDTHRHYLERFAEQMVDLGPNLVGTRTGLVVPDVSAGRQTGRDGMRGRSANHVESIGDLRQHGERYGRRIVGIDPAAGIMRATREAMRAYGLEGWRLLEGSEGQMTRELTEAIRRKQSIAVTGWIPHWMFGRWSLRILEDPKGVYGEQGAIHTMSRYGLAEEMPEVYRFLDRFNWTPRDIEQLMLWIELDNGLDPYGKAVRWLKAHPEEVSEWLDDGA